MHLTPAFISTYFRNYIIFLSYFSIIFLFYPILTFYSHPTLFSYFYSTLFSSLIKKSISRYFSPLFSPICCFFSSYHVHDQDLNNILINHTTHLLLLWQIRKRTDSEIDKIRFLVVWPDRLSSGWEDSCRWSQSAPWRHLTSKGHSHDRQREHSSLPYSCGGQACLGHG
jgi:hypothetical protein